MTPPTLRLFVVGSSLLSLLGIVPSFGVANAYDVLRDYSGQNFFNGWDFYSGWDNLTQGDAWYLDQQSASQQQLAYINAQGNAIIKVDNSTNLPFGDKRDSIRITSQDGYNIGTLWIFDIVHLPYGCSVWPAIWSFGPNWPFGGEIDILENINLATTNQMALHSTPGCFAQPNVTQSGTPILADCGTASGCTVRENKPNSYSSGFATAGGGVWAVQFDSSGIFMWFFSRPEIPANIQSSTPTSSITDLSSWGPPSAAYPASSCNIPEFFTAQNIVFDITLCGDWAGVPSIYNTTCPGPGPNSTGICYHDNIPGPGNNFDNAYFEISYVRVYSTPGPAPTVTPDATNSYTLIQDTSTTTISAEVTTYATTFMFGGHLALLNSTGSAPVPAPTQSDSQNNGGNGSPSNSAHQGGPTQSSDGLMMTSVGCSTITLTVMVLTMIVMIM